MEINRVKRGRPMGTANNRNAQKYNVAYFDLNTKEWYYYHLSSYQHIKESLSKDHDVNISVYVLQNIVLGKKKDKLLKITKEVMS
jgi:hypothetical protein